MQFFQVLYCKQSYVSRVLGIKSESSHFIFFPIEGLVFFFIIFIFFTCPSAPCSCYTSIRILHFVFKVLLSAYGVGALKIYLFYNMESCIVSHQQIKKRL